MSFLAALLPGSVGAAVIVILFSGGYWRVFAVCYIISVFAMLGLFTILDKYPQKWHKQDSGEE